MLLKNALATLVLAAALAAGASALAAPRTGYATVNGLSMYYEVHGSGRPLLLLHGALMTIENFGDILPGLAASRQVFAVEQQAHGHTKDIDRPLRYQQMADDTAALLRELGVQDADVVGYSMGGGVALQLAVRHPDLVRKLVIVSSGHSTAGFLPGLTELIAKLKPEDFVGSPWFNSYIAAAGNADGWPTLVHRVVELVGMPFDWSREVAAIRVPTLVVVGDVDNFLPQHALDLFHLLGGRTIDPYGQRMPRAQLAVLPGTSHVGMLDRADWLVPMIEAFLNRPIPEAQ